MLVLFVPATALVWKMAGAMPDSLRSATDKFQTSEIAFATAIFHSAFNLLNIALLVGFVPQIAGIVQMWVKDKAGESTAPRLQYISQGLVELGELNLAEAESATRRMHSLTSRMFDGFVSVLKRPDEDLTHEVVALKAMEDECDVLLHDITSYLIQCSSHEIGAANAGRITSMLRVVSEYEEATDRIYRLVKSLQRKHKEKRVFGAEHDREISALCGQVRAILDLCGNALSGVNGEMLDHANQLEDRIDKLRKQHNQGAIKRMQSGADVPTEMVYTELNNHLEAIGNHSLNIIQSAELLTGKGTLRVDDV
jgi:phosphate:Na+ symporter